MINPGSITVNAMHLMLNGTIAVETWSFVCNIQRAINIETQSRRRRLLRHRGWV